ncbi:MAG: alkaline phosphatase family protein [Candidatus Sericytochromatia bacterium]|nr:alkaline phosphatase family protein [Candidatus Tanganyikabacteria bacterium]
MPPLPLHLIVIDGLHPGLLRAELAAGRLPAFGRLVRAGTLHDAISTFPTVTPSALASIATGLPPSGHGIQGIMWFDRREDRYVHYWPSPQSVLAGTFGQVMRDILHNLNDSHLEPSAPTLFEILEGAGIPSAAVNFPIFRGPYLHHGQVPLALALLAGLPVGITVRGPRHLLVGDILRPLISIPRGPLGRYGISDERAIRYTRRLVTAGKASFFLTYLPDNDLRSHHHGPAQNAESLHLLDRLLGSLLDAYGSWDEAVTRARWLVVGDHAQTLVGGVEGYSVNVYKEFRSARILPFGKSGLGSGQYDLAMAANDRSALIYLARPAARDGVLAELASWPSVDRIMGRDGDGWFWASDARGERQLRFRRGGPWRDERGDSWELSGSPAVLDLRESGMRLVEGRYPDPLFRIAGALSRADLAVTAEPGFEFTTGFKLGHGNHGSLAAGDSITALIEVGVEVPARPRILDVLPAISRAFGLGAGHALPRG